METVKRRGDRNFNTNTKNNDEWLTPPYIVQSLGVFDLDPCAPINRPWNMTKKHYTELDDGLTKHWLGRVWCNPPYGRETFRWLAKLAKHGRGIALIFARTETIGFHEQIWSKAHSVFFFKGRLKFYHVNGSQGGMANAPSCLVSYSQQDTIAIQFAINKNLIKGKLVCLHND